MWTNEKELLADVWKFLTETQAACPVCGDEGLENCEFHRLEFAKLNARIVECLGHEYAYKKVVA